MERPGALVFAVGFCVVIVAGCGKGETVSPHPPARVRSSIPKPKDPDEELHDQMHAAAFQVNEALDHLNDAVSGLRPLAAEESSETKHAILDVIDTFDTAGRAVGEFTDAPDVAEIRADREGQTERQAKEIAGIRGVVEQLEDAESTLDDLIASGPPEKIRQVLQDANDSADAASDALSEAVRQLGGAPKG